MFDPGHLEPEVIEGYRLLREEAALVRLPGFAAIEVTGEDRKGWLQGQVTSDLRELTEGSSSPFCMCSPTGQLLSFGTVWALPGRFAMSVPLASRKAILERFESMVILEDVAACPMDDLVFLSVQGPEATSRLSGLVTMPPLDAAHDDFGLCLRSNRTGYGGWDLLIEPSRAKNIEKAFPTATAEAIDIARLEAGIPLFGKDTGPKTLPPELGPAFESSHISYTKGCYTGQEVLMRIHSRGHTNRTWIGLVADCPLQEGAIISAGGRADAGAVTSAAYSPSFGHIGAGYVRNDVLPEHSGIITATVGAAQAELRHMPLLRLA